MRRLDRVDLLRLHRGRIGLAPEFDTAPLQLGMRGEPWRTAVASVLLNRTSNVAVRPVLRELLNTWPTPDSLATASLLQVELVVEPCGLQRSRGRTLTRLSEEWLGTWWRDLRDLYGVGPYVADAVGLFCLGDLDVESNDRVLLRHARSLSGRTVGSPEGKGGTNAT